MKKITLNIPDKKYPFFIELIKSLDFVSVSNPSQKMEKASEHPVLKSLKQGLKEVELVKQGKIKSRSLKDFLYEV